MKSFFLAMICCFFMSCTGSLKAPGRLATDRPADHLVFKKVWAGKQSVEWMLLYNSGATRLTIDKIELVDNKHNAYSLLEAPSTPFVLKPGSRNGVLLKVGFLSIRAGVFRARIAVKAGDAINVDNNELFYIHLEHSLLTPRPMFSCTSPMTFSNVPIGKTSDRLCEVFNKGNAPWDVSAIVYERFTGSDKDFLFGGVRPPFSLSPLSKSTFKFQIQFAPTTLVDASGVFRFESSLIPGHGMSRIEVMGTVAKPTFEVIPVLPVCSDSLFCLGIHDSLTCHKLLLFQEKRCVPRSLRAHNILFPLMREGDSMTLDFYIRVDGDAPLDIVDIRLDAGLTHFTFSKRGEKFPMRLTKGQSVMFSVSYHAFDANLRHGQLTLINYKDTFHIGLQSQAKGCILNHEPKDISFARPGRKIISLSNIGNDRCLIQKVFLQNGDDAPFSLSYSSIRYLKPGSNIVLNVSFQPEHGQAEAVDAVVVRHSAFNPDIIIPLRGKL